GIRDKLVTGVQTCALPIYQHGGPATAYATNGPLVAMILSNQSSAAYLPGSFQSGQNIISANTFEWTNGSRSSSSIRSLSAVKGRSEERRVGKESRGGRELR